ncbi:MAG: hypothetical protein GY720_17555 [bacterium]|nr:hypothetical protein [bacterium]
MPHWIYQFSPGERSDLATNPDAWTEADNQIGTDHFERLRVATEAGIVILAGRSPDGVGPALVIFEAEDEANAKAFMEADPFLSEGLFTAELHPFRAALVRNPQE